MTTPLARSPCRSPAHLGAWSAIERHSLKLPTSGGAVQQPAVRLRRAPCRRVATEDQYLVPDGVGKGVCPAGTAGLAHRDPLASAAVRGPVTTGSSPRRSKGGAGRRSPPGQAARRRQHRGPGGRGGAGGPPRSPVPWECRRRGAGVSGAHAQLPAEADPRGQAWSASSRRRARRGRRTWAPGARAVRTPPSRAARRGSPRSRPRWSSAEEAEGEHRRWAMGRASSAGQSSGRSAAAASPAPPRRRSAPSPPPPHPRRAGRRGGPARGVGGAGGLFTVFTTARHRPGVHVVDLPGAEVGPAGGRKRRPPPPSAVSSSPQST